MNILKKIDYKRLIIILVITFLIGNLFSFFTVANEHQIDILNKPKFYPPKFLFPIVWSILYILMSVGIYLVSVSNITSEEKTKIYKLYGMQLAINSMWTLVFFGLQQRLIAFFFIILLIILVIVMTVKMYKINKTAGIIQIPYIVWLLLASYLNLSIYLLN